MRRLRLASGLVLLTYVTLHLLNHALLNVSVDAADAMLRLQKFIWRGVLGSTLLYGALAAHGAIGLWSLYARRSGGKVWAERAQLLLGLVFPAMIANHVAVTPARLVDLRSRQRIHRRTERALGGRARLGLAANGGAGRRLGACLHRPVVPAASAPLVADLAARTTDGRRRVAGPRAIGLRGGRPRGGARGGHTRLPHDLPSGFGRRQRRAESPSGRAAAVVSSRLRRGHPAHPGRPRHPAAPPRRAAAGWSSAIPAASGSTFRAASACWTPAATRGSPTPASAAAKAAAPPAVCAFLWSAPTAPRPRRP